MAALVDILLHLEVDIIGPEMSARSQEAGHIILLKAHDTKASRHDLRNES